MAEYLIQDSTLAAIADAIKEKIGNNDPIKVAEYAAKIQGISSSGEATQFVETRGTYYASTDGRITMYHNLGVLPDFVTIKGYTTGSKVGDIISIECVPNKDANSYTQIAQCRSSLGVTTWTETTPITSTDNTAGFVTVTPNSFSVGGSLFKNVAGATYEYHVIGGLIR